MARIRTIKPEFFTSEQVVECSPMARLLFVGMWCFCDDGGVHPASAVTLKMEVFPADSITADDIRGFVSELEKHGLISTYQASGKSFWRVLGWHHQKIDRPTYKHPKSKEFGEESARSRRTLGEESPPESNGVEGNGVEGKVFKDHARPHKKSGAYKRLTPEDQEAVDRWAGYWLVTQHCDWHDTQCESALMDAARLGLSQRLPDVIDFSISRNCKSWKNPDDNWDKQRKAGSHTKPRVDTASALEALRKPE